MQENVVSQNSFQWLVLQIVISRIKNTQNLLCFQDLENLINTEPIPKLIKKAWSTFPFIRCECESILVRARIMEMVWQIACPENPTIRVYTTWIISNLTGNEI